MSLALTLRTLTRSRNESATDVLAAALDGPLASVREGAMRALLDRRSAAGRRELVRRWHQFPDGWKAYLAERGDRLGAAVREAILSPDPQTAANGCDAVLQIRDYDLAPALIAGAEAENNPRGELAAETMLRLAELLYEELSAPRTYKLRRDPQLVRRHLTSTLEGSLERYERHRRRSLLEAFLLLAHRDSATLRRVVQTPTDPAHDDAFRLFAAGRRPGMLRLLLSFLEDAAGAPPPLLRAIAARHDVDFLARLARKVGPEPPPPVRLNLKRIDALPWLGEEPVELLELEPDDQALLPGMILATGVPRLKSFSLVRFLLERGAIPGRRAAARALAEFHGLEANELAARTLDDDDPEVQAAAVRQVRERGMPGAMTRLIALVDSPHETVREAARESLSEFSFERYLSAFDLIDEEVRGSTGALVKKVDAEYRPRLREEFHAPTRTRRFRAAQIAEALDDVAAFRRELLAILADEDHFVRAAAARALGGVDDGEVRRALRDALLDRSVAVQEAAQQSLRRLADHASETPEAPDLPTGPEPAGADEPPPAAAASGADETPPAPFAPAAAATPPAVPEEPRA